jgi:hypothetical protein
VFSCQHTPHPRVPNVGRFCQVSLKVLVACPVEVIHPQWGKIGLEEDRMGQKHHKPEEIIAKLRRVEVLTSQGRSVAEAVRSIEVSEQTHFRWRAEYGGMKTDPLKRLTA